MTADQFIKLIDTSSHRTQRIVSLFLDEHLTYRPVPEMKSLCELALHVAGSYQYLHRGIITDDWTRKNCLNIDTPLPIKSLVDIVKRECEFVKQSLSSRPDERLQQIVTPLNIQMSLWVWIQQTADHETHHRGQLYVYVRLCGIEPPFVYGK